MLPEPLCYRLGRPIREECHGWSCTATLLIIRTTPKPGKMPHLNPCWRGQRHGFTPFCQSGDSPELAQGLPYKGKSMRNRGVSSPMPFLLIPRSLLRGGFILGAQQTYEWAVRFPEKVQRAAAIAGTARTTPHNFLFVDALADAITSDPAWVGGWYREAHAVREGLRRHSRLWAVMGFSSEVLKAEAWRVLGFSSLDDFLLNLLDASFLLMDPNNLLCMARKWQHADVSRHTAGDLAAALDRIDAKMMVMPISSDMFFTATDCAAEQKLIRGSELKVLETHWGHIGLFGMDPHYLQQVDAALEQLLA